MHALERSGKKREALVLLWEILVSNVVFVDTGGNNDKEKDPKEVWVELYERIESLSDATDIINDASSSRNNGLDIQLLNAVQRLDVRAYTPIAMPKGGTTSTVIAAASSSASNKSSGKNSKNQKGGKNKSSKKSSANAAAPVLLPPVTDETVLQTLCVTLRIEGLYDTMSEIYFQAMETLSSNKQASDTENYRGVLEEGVSVHFKAVCDCSAVGLEGGVDGSVAGAKNNGDGGNIMTSPQSIVQAQLPKLQTLLNLTKYYERMQTCELNDQCLGVFILYALFLMSIECIIVFAHSITPTCQNIRTVTPFSMDRHCQFMVQGEPATACYCIGKDSNFIE